MNVFINIRERGGKRRACTKFLFNQTFQSTIIKNQDMNCYEKLIVKKNSSVITNKPTYVNVCIGDAMLGTVDSVELDCAVVMITSTQTDSS